MKTSDPSHPSFTGTGWQKLGDLNLPLGGNIETILYTWLAEHLKPLGLQKGLLNKILKSVQGAASRAVQTEEAARFERIHLSVLTLPKKTAEGSTWGYFHIEKLDKQIVDAEASTHAVDLYLYMEGE